MKLLLDRFKYAFQGFVYMAKEKNIRMHVFFGIFMIILGYVYRISFQEWFWTLLCIALVISMETVNSCIEALADEISLERKPSIKRIKDMAAGAVLVVTLFAVVIGIIIFVPKSFGGFL
jgi:diacylglycerol kinase